MLSPLICRHAISLRCYRFAAAAAADDVSLRARFSPFFRHAAFAFSLFRATLRLLMLIDAAIFATILLMLIRLLRGHADFAIAIAAD